MLNMMVAECIIAATATQEALWLQFLIQEMGLKVATLIVSKEENKVCINFPDHLSNHRHFKHVDFRYHFVTY